MSPSVLLSMFVAFFLSLNLVLGVQIPSPNSSEIPSRIWVQSQAEKMTEKLPLGNGRLGAMVSGGNNSDVITLNEDSVWNGGFLYRVNPDAFSTVSKMQQLLRNGSIVEAYNLATQGFVGTPVSEQHYVPLGQLTIAQTYNGTSSNYERWLDLADATSGVYFTSNGIVYQREYLASYPEDIIAIRLSASQQGSVSFNIHLDRLELIGGLELNRFEDYSIPHGGDTILMGGRTSGNESIGFATGARVVASGGTVSTLGDYVNCAGADEAYIYFSAWSTYRREKPYDAVLTQLSTISNKPYNDIRTAHVADYIKYIDRVSLDLGKSSTAQKSKSTPCRMASFSLDNFDPELVALYFQYGRYILTATSRRGSLPPNLQGNWNDNFNPDWGSKFTLDINLGMSNLIARMSPNPASRVILLT